MKGSKSKALIALSTLALVAGAFATTGAAMAREGGHGHSEDSHRGEHRGEGRRGEYRRGEYREDNERRGDYRGYYRGDDGRYYRDMNYHMNYRGGESE